MKLNEYRKAARFMDRLLAILCQHDDVVKINAWEIESNIDPDEETVSLSMELEFIPVDGCNNTNMYASSSYEATSKAARELVNELKDSIKIEIDGLEWVIEDDPELSQIRRCNSAYLKELSRKITQTVAGTK